MKHITKILFAVTLILVLCGASCDEPPTPTPFQGTLRMRTAVPFIIVTSVHGEGFYREITLTPTGSEVPPTATPTRPTKTPGPIMITIPDETRGPGWAIQVTATP